MPRYLVERTFPDGLGIPATADGARACLGVVENNAEAGVTWLHSVRHGGPAQDVLRLRRAYTGGDQADGGT